MIWVSLDSIFSCDFRSDGHMTPYIAGLGRWLKWDDMGIIGVDQISPSNLNPKKEISQMRNRNSGRNSEAIQTFVSRRFRLSQNANANSGQMGPTDIFQPNLSHLMFLCIQT